MSLLTLGMYLTEIQLDIIRSWAEQTPQVQEACLFGSYAKGEAHASSDVHIAIRAAAVDWTFLTAKWEQYLSKAIGVQVNIRTLELPNVCRYCAELACHLRAKARS